MLTLNVIKKNSNKILLAVGAIAAISIIFVCIKCYKTKSSDTEDKFLEEDDNNNQSSDDKDDKLIIMLFYADWCGHCKQFKPEFDKFQEQLKVEVDDSKYEVKLMNADDDSVQPEMGKYGVTGFPTLLCENKKTKESCPYPSFE